MVLAAISRQLHVNGSRNDSINWGKCVPMNLGDFAKKLTRAPNGLWTSQVSDEVSYPREAHGLCFEVEDSSFWFQHRNAVITRLVIRYGNGQTIFDVGGGNGCVSLALQRAGMDVVVVEPGLAGTLNALHRGIKNVAHSKLQDAGFSSNSLSNIGLFDVIEHIEDDVRFLADVWEYQRPGAVLFITVPAFDWLWSDDDITAGHYRRYSRPAIEGKLRRCGYSILYSSYFFSFLLPILYLRRSLASKLGRRTSDLESASREDHVVSSGVARSIINRCTNYEIGRLERGKSLSFGTSCVIVARK